MKKLAIVLLTVVAASTVNSTIINVPSDSTTIQTGITGAVAGDTVLIAPGTYLEAVTINKEIVVVCSTFADRPIIDGGGSACVTFSGSVGNSCLLRGFILTGGPYGANLSAGRPLIDSCTFTGMSNWQVYQAHPQEAGYYASHNEFLPNPTGKYNGLLIRSGIISDSTIWPALPSGMVYYLSGTNYTVSVAGPSCPELLIEPGVIVKSPPPVHPGYNNDDPRFFQVGVGNPGLLTAYGVHFTAITDDNLGGDSNGDGYSFPTAPYWSSIYFGGQDCGSVMDSCFIWYGGNAN